MDLRRWIFLTSIMLLGKAFVFLHAVPTSTIKIFNDQGIVNDSLPMPQEHIKKAFRQIFTPAGGLLCNLNYPFAEGPRPDYIIYVSTTELDILQPLLVRPFSKEDDYNAYLTALSAVISKAHAVAESRKLAGPSGRSEHFLSWAKLFEEHKRRVEAAAQTKQANVVINVFNDQGTIVNSEPMTQEYVNQRYRQIPTPAQGMLVNLNYPLAYNIPSSQRVYLSLTEYEILQPLMNRNFSRAEKDGMDYLSALSEVISKAYTVAESRKLAGPSGRSEHFLSWAKLFEEHKRRVEAATQTKQANVVINVFNDQGTIVKAVPMAQEHVNQRYRQIPMPAQGMLVNLNYPLAYKVPSSQKVYLSITEYEILQPLMDHNFSRAEKDCTDYLSALSAVISKARAVAESRKLAGPTGRSEHFLSWAKLFEEHKHIAEANLPIKKAASPETTEKEVENKIDKMDIYEILGIPSNTPQEVLNKISSASFKRQQNLACHPDKYDGNPIMAKKFAITNNLLEHMRPEYARENGNELNDLASMNHFQILGMPPETPKNLLKKMLERKALILRPWNPEAFGEPGERAYEFATKKQEKMEAALKAIGE